MKNYKIIIKVSRDRYGEKLIEMEVEPKGEIPVKEVQQTIDQLKEFPE